MSREPDPPAPKHVDIALTAIARGIIDMHTFAEALVAAGSQNADLEAVWLRSGRLNQRQLDSILLTLADPVGKRLVPQTLTFGEPAAAPAPIPIPGPAPADPAPRRTVLGTAPQANPPIPAATGVAETMPVKSEPRVDELPTRYKILSSLGRGGMGDVFACFDPVLQRRVALKALRPELLRSREGAGMLEREARLTGRLEHPSIIAVYDAGEDPSLGPYYVMPVVERPSLQDLLDRLRASPGLEIEYTLHRLLRVFVQVCNAIDYAHSQRVIHCDLKPANILLGPFGEVLVVDWGLGQSAEAGAAQRGGTPGYMPPEQMAGAEVDARADVYALGAILYALLTLEPALTDKQLESAVGTIQCGDVPSIVPVPPSARAPHRNIPAEIEEVCLKALWPSRANRYQTVRELCASVETFIEGRREHDRRLVRAEELVESADALARAYQDFLESRPLRDAELDALRSRIPPYAKQEQKRPIWDAEDSIRVLDTLAIRTLQGAIGAYEQALDEEPKYAPARRGLAQLYFLELERARARRDEFNRVYFEGLVRQFDDGSLGSLLDERGSLKVTVNDAKTGVTIERYEMVDRKLAAKDARPLPHPIQKLDLESGPYLVTVKGNGFLTRSPVLVRAGKEAVLEIDADVARTAEPGMIYVPGGCALIRGEDEQDLSEVRVPPFFIGELPVTFDVYLRFVADSFKADPELGEEYLPRSETETPFWNWDGTRLVAVNVRALGVDDVEAARALPAVGIDVQSAVAFTDWLAGRTQKHYRLPSEDEWEKAARGVDGRRYPWGDHFDASFCLMRQSQPGIPKLERSGAFGIDVSPYGVRDLAGGVADWIRPGPRELTAIARGGAWCDWATSCRVAVRSLYWAGERSTRVGFRIARSA